MHKFLIILLNYALNTMFGQAAGIGTTTPDPAFKLAVNGPITTSGPRTTDMTARHCIEVSNTISTNNIIYGGESSDVLSKAENQVALLPGFQVPAYSNFRGNFKVCGVW